jgi:hypothetical protein
LPSASTGIGVSSACSFDAVSTATNGINQRAQQRAGGANIARQQRAIEVDAFAGVNDDLAVQRQMIGELRQHMRQQAGPAMLRLIGRLGAGA